HHRFPVRLAVRKPLGEALRLLERPGFRGAGGFDQISIGHTAGLCWSAGARASAGSDACDSVQRQKPLETVTLKARTVALRGESVAWAAKTVTLRTRKCRLASRKVTLCAVQPTAAPARLPAPAPMPRPKREHA